jgi:hypothetical protein
LTFKNSYANISVLLTTESLLCIEDKNNIKKLELPCRVRQFKWEVWAMPIKIKIIPSRGAKVEVKIRRPQWQQFIKY